MRDILLDFDGSRFAIDLDACIVVRPHMRRLLYLIQDYWTTGSGGFLLKLAESKMSTHPLFLKHSDIMNANPDTQEDKERLVEEIKSRGNFSFKAKSFEEAEVLYTQALVHVPKQVVR